MSAPRHPAAGAALGPRRAPGRRGVRGLHPADRRVVAAADPRSVRRGCRWAGLRGRPPRRAGRRRPHLRVGRGAEREPPHRLVLTLAPGRGAGHASEVEVRFAAVDGGGTRVELEHRGWERFGADAVHAPSGTSGPGAWGHVLDHFADGAEPARMPPTSRPCATAYEAFFAEAERGGFGEPPPGEWDAGQVLAHVALNDLALTAVAHAWCRVAATSRSATPPARTRRCSPTTSRRPATSPPSWPAAASSPRSPRPRCSGSTRTSAGHARAVPVAARR